MSENIVILSGSPRKGGNTDRLVAAFTEGAESAGKKVTVFRVADMRIGACKGCNHCFEEKGVCVQKDDMLPILETIKNATSLVLASPVYYHNVSAQLKTAIDRMYALIPVGNQLKTSALLMTCGAPHQEPADPAIAMYKGMCALGKREDAGIVVAPGLHAPGEIEGREELKQAWTLGQAI